MALNIADEEIERLAAEVAALAHETETDAIRHALIERKERLGGRRGNPEKRKRLRALLRDEIWPQIPPDVFGKPVSKEEREEILGYGPEGF